MNDELNKTIDDRIKAYMSSTGFIGRKLSDTPLDSLSLVNRKYVTLNGATASRPLSSVIGQSYFDTSLGSGNGKPIWYGPNGWVDATGSAV